MKHALFSPVIAALVAAFGDGLRVTWVDGREFVRVDGKWKLDQGEVLE